MNMNLYPMPSLEHYTPDQLLAILDLLEALNDTIRDAYELQLARDQLDLFADYGNEDDQANLDSMPF
jgi:hypothetical protein